MRAIVNAFIDRVFEDRMIGFFFRNADRARIKEMEYQLAGSFLGADIKYTGRPLGKAHVNHPIMGGHFCAPSPDSQRNVGSLSGRWKKSRRRGFNTPILCDRLSLLKRVRIAIRSLRERELSGDNYR